MDSQITRRIVLAMSKWILLVVAIVSFGILGWAAKVTYSTVPPQPDKFISESEGANNWRGHRCGKADFKGRPHGLEIYGMGSYLALTIPLNT